MTVDQGQLSRGPSGAEGGAVLPRESKLQRKNFESITGPMSGIEVPFAAWIGNKGLKLVERGLMQWSLYFRKGFKECLCPARMMINVQEADSEKNVGELSVSFIEKARETKDIDIVRLVDILYMFGIFCRDVNTRLWFLNGGRMDPELLNLTPDIQQVLLALSYHIEERTGVNGMVTQNLLGICNMTPPYMFMNVSCDTSAEVGCGLPAVCYEDVKPVLSLNY